MTDSVERKTFHIIGRPKPVDPAHLFEQPKSYVPERGDIVKHTNGKYYRVQKYYHGDVYARHILMMDTDNGGYRNWRFGKTRGTVRLAASNLEKVQR